MSNTIESLLEPGIQKAINSAAIHLNENTRDELLGASLVRFAKSGTGKTLLTLAVYSDSLRIVFDTLLADGKITAKEVEVSKSFLAKAAASYAKVRSQYAPFASLKDAEIIPFLKMYQRDTGSFGHLHTSTKWSGIAVCQNIAKKTGDSTALNTLRETLLKGAKALLLADGMDQKEVIYLKKLEEELHGKTSAPKPVQNTSGMDSALAAIIQGDFKALEASSDSDEWIKGNCTRITSWQKAAELNDPRGQVLLGLCFIFGHGVKKNHNEGVKWQMKAAEQSLAAGQYNVGVCYDNGVGVQEDKKEAIKWWHLAAIQGFPRAQYNLGICYDNGEGVKEDKKEAFKWYLLAAEQGDADAQCYLGISYRDGLGVEEDKKEAVKWYRMAAEQGDVDAQYNLGTGYYNGEGVQEDKKEAVKWYRMAAEQGDEKSLEMIKNYNEDSDSDYDDDDDSSSDSDSDSDYEDDEEDENEDEDGLPNQLENFKTPRDVFRVATRIDAEELIEGSFSSLYDEVRKKLIKHGIELEEDCIEEDVDTSEGVTTVSYNDQEYILCNNDIEDSWERGAYVFFMIINSQIYDKNLKFYAVNGGNDLSGILLKKSEGARLMKLFANDEDLPYIPELPKSMNAVGNELEESDTDSDEDELLQTSQRTHISTSRRLEPWGTIINSLGMKLVSIKPGSFLMGGREGEAGYNALEEQLHHVEITRPFYLGMFQVTQYEYITVMGDNPSVFNGYTKPVEHISWKQAFEFCNKLSQLPAEKSEGRFYRLPTEAEWEYACRAGSDTAFAYGHKLTALQARFCERVLSTPQPTMPVGMFPPNNWGLHDMHGNVWEWCSDWYQLDYYSKSPKADPKGPAKGTYHVLRGGSASVKAFECRSAIRGESMMDKPYANSNVRFEAIGDFGLRVVCELRK